MKRLIALALLLAPSISFGGWSSDYVRSAGNYIQTSKVTVTTHTATLLWTPTTDAVGVDVFNNSAYTLWVGTNTTTLQTTGFPILSSATYTTDGRYTGSVYGTIDAGSAANRDTRVIRYFKN